MDDKHSKGNRLSTFEYEGDSNYLLLEGYI